MLNVQKGLWIKIEPKENVYVKERKVRFHLGSIYSTLEEQEWVYTNTASLDENHLITWIQVLIDDRQLAEVMEIIENNMKNVCSKDGVIVYDYVQVSSTDSFEDRLIQKYIQWYRENQSQGKVYRMSEQELFSKAVAFAAEKHSKQTRKDGTPYICHPLKVAELLKEAGYNLKYQIAAVLHDTLEDTDATEEEIREFGEDVFEAVRLVTRPDGMDEEDYVAKILENHMATAVKNADKIHNMWDVQNCGDFEWGKKYAEKVKRYYEGKLSGALDKAIGKAIRINVYTSCQENPLFYTKEEMTLYCDKEEQHQIEANLRYLEAKKWYEGNTISPDFENSDIQYWYESLVKYYFCFSKKDEYWILGSAGWRPTKNSPFLEDEYGTYLQKRSREDVDRHIEKMKKERMFYDFVDTTKL